MSDVPTVELVEQLRRANAGLREVLTSRDAQLAARDAQIGELQAMVHALGLQVAELQRRLGSGSDDSGVPTSKESIEAKARRKAERQARQEQQDQDQEQEPEPRGGSSRQRSKDKARGGQPGHPGHGLRRDPNPNQQVPVEAPPACRGCGDDLSGAADAGMAWSQSWDVKILPWRIEYLLPRRRCACTVTTVAQPPGGSLVNSISFGPVLNTAAVALTAFGNVPTERCADLIKILYGQDVSAGFVDRANTRLAAKLTAAGFEQAMLAALLAEPVLAADESPVNVITPAIDPDTGELIPGSPHVLAIRTPDERLAWLAGLTSRSYDTVIAALRGFAGHLIVDGYGAYQRLRTSVGAVLAGIQQCCQHVMRRCRGVAKLGPGSLQSWWTGQVTDALTEAHSAVQDAKANQQIALDPDLLADLRQRYDKAVTSGITHNRHRDWHDGNHPGYTLATWLNSYADQVWHFTRHLNVDWTSNAAERGVKPAKRHQAVSGYWQTHATLNRWCLIKSYLTTTRNHGLTVLDAITRALTSQPWLPTPTTAA